MKFNPNDLTTQIGFAGVGFIILFVCLVLKLKNGTCPKGLLFIGIVLFVLGVVNIIRLKRTTDQ